MKRSLLAALVVLFTTLAPVAHAQWAVFDAPNFSQNILTVAQTSQQIENQITQLQNEATMLENEARNLKGLNLNTLPQILNLLSTTDRLIQQSQGPRLQRVADEHDVCEVLPHSPTPQEPASLS